jgi:hypothetical protein
MSGEDAHLEQDYEDRVSGAMFASPDEWFDDAWIEPEDDDGDDS